MKTFDLELGRYVDDTPTMEQLPQKAVVYARVSSKKQVEEGDGGPSQIRRCKQRLSDNGNVSVIGTYQDEGKSGRVLSRDGLNEALKQAEEQGATHFICTEISRVSRSEAILGLEIVNVLRDLGCKLILVNQGGEQDLNSEISNLMMFIKLRQAETEGNNIGARSRAGKVNKLLDGYRPFKDVPCGYDKTRVKVGKKSSVLPVPNETYGPIIKEALELFSVDIIESKADLYRFLKEKKFVTNCKPKTRKKGEFNLSLLDSILNEQRLFFYAGYILNPKYDIDEPIEGKHLPLISLDTAKKVLSKVFGKKRSHKYNVMSNDQFPHKGMLYCESCGEKLTTSPSCKYKTCKETNERIKIPYDYYICINKSCELHRKSLPKNKIEEGLQSIIGGLSTSKNTVELLHKIQNKVREQAMKEQEISEVCDEKRLQAISQEQETIMDKLMSVQPGKLFDTFQERRNKLEQESKVIRGKKEKVFDESKDFDELLSILSETLEHPLALWKKGDVNMKHLLAKVRFNSKIHYSKEQGCRTPEKSVIFGPKESFFISSSSYSRTLGFEPRLMVSETTVLTIDTTSLSRLLDR